ncbi:2TM domain-containing protein [Dokdonia ponticola]|uniref:2TM domain-containing protein n=1 Tax=Dokdonia ponticola TaxID=2041041 RepID=A0ABV9HX66_9FLAO
MGLFSKKTTPAIDPEQRALIENAQARIRQKKKLYRHFVLFLAGAVLMIIINPVLGIGKDITLFGYDWFLWAILLWTFFFLVHAINVFVLKRFMGKEWEEEQINALVIKQQKRIAELEEQVAILHPLPEKKSSNLTSETTPTTPTTPTIDPNSPL